MSWDCCIPASAASRWASSSPNALRIPVRAPDAEVRKPRIASSPTVLLRSSLLGLLS